MSVPGVVYVLHIEPPYLHAGHYIGWTGGPAQARFEQHLAGTGSPLIRAAVAAGHRVTLVYEVPGDRNRERQLKRIGGHGRRICPLCRPEHLAERRARERAPR